MASHARQLVVAALIASTSAVVAARQTPTPQPFPQPAGSTARGSQPAPAQPAPAQPAPRQQAPAPAQTPAPVQTPAPAQAEATPTEATLGVPIYPNAVFIRSYDAGRGQRYYVFGSAAPFADMVSYYRSVLKERGNLVFEVPPTHVFEVGRFREETMAFPPSVTVKDYTFSGSAGFPNPAPGGKPERFPTLIQIVPPPAGTAPARD